MIEVKRNEHRNKYKWVSIVCVWFVWVYVCEICCIQQSRWNVLAGANNLQLVDILLVESSEERENQIVFVYIYRCALLLLRLNVKIVFSLVFLIKIKYKNIYKFFLTCFKFCLFEFYLFIFI